LIDTARYHTGRKVGTFDRRRQGRSPPAKLWNSTMQFRDWSKANVTGGIMVLMAVAPNALGLSPALPTDSTRACLHLKSGTLELTAESQRTLAAFISFVSPIQKVLSVDVSYSRTVSGSNLEDPPLVRKCGGIDHDPGAAVWRFSCEELDPEEHFSGSRRCGRRIVAGASQHGSHGMRHRPWCIRPFRPTSRDVSNLRLHSRPLWSPRTIRTRPSGMSSLPATSLSGPPADKVQIRRRNSAGPYRAPQDGIGARSLRNSAIVVVVIHPTDLLSMVLTVEGDQIDAVLDSIEGKHLLATGRNNLDVDPSNRSGNFHARHVKACRGMSVASHQRPRCNRSRARGEGIQQSLILLVPREFLFARPKAMRAGLVCIVL
jgi:hypothetical protein